MKKISKKLMGILLATAMMVSFAVTANAIEVEAADVGVDHVCTEGHDHSTVIFTEVNVPESLISTAAACQTHRVGTPYTQYNGGGTSSHPLYDSSGKIVASCTVRSDYYTTITPCSVCGATITSNSFVITSHSICN